MVSSPTMRKTSPGFVASEKNKKKTGLSSPSGGKAKQIKCDTVIFSYSTYGDVKLLPILKYSNITYQFRAIYYLQNFI